ncbi:hypothetical protein NL676_018395 [Syzygium grande]|nr:hypothetical protein NL676_018395 [Syzygium grande]
METVFNAYNYYYESPWPGPSPICYRHSSCNRLITRDDCTEWMTFAAQQIIEQCPMAIGAQIQLADCRARYEQYEFKE